MLCKDESGSSILTSLTGLRSLDLRVNTFLSCFPFRAYSKTQSKRIPKMSLHLRRIPCILKKFSCNTIREYIYIYRCMQDVGRHTCGMRLECNSLEGCECFTFGHMSYAFEIASKTGEMHLNALAVQQSRGSIARSKTQLKWCREQTLNALEIQSPKSNGLKCNSGKLGNAHTQWWK